MQGFPKRSVDDAKTEVQERGSHEGFTESFKDNAALLRRRVRSPIMKCETLTVGTTSKTRICVCYMSDRASQETVDNIKARLKKAKLDMVLGSGYIAPFLDTQSTSFFRASVPPNARMLPVLKWRRGELYCSLTVRRLR